MQSDDLQKIATSIGNRWRKSPYYDRVEGFIDVQWNRLIAPFIGDVDLTNCVDLAAGHGRNTAKLIEKGAAHVYIVDINQENIDFCMSRFGENNRITYVKNNGFDVAEVPSNTITLFYSFDAMVHFDSDLVRSYLAEVRRTLTSEGKAFLHHSNTTSNPTGDYLKNEGWRNFMSRELFAHYAVKEGLTVIRQQLVDWRRDASLIDCFSLLGKV